MPCWLSSPRLAVSPEIVRIEPIRMGSPEATSTHPNSVSGHSGPAAPPSPSPSPSSAHAAAIRATALRMARYPSRLRIPPPFGLPPAARHPTRATGSRVVRRDPVLVSPLPSPLSWWTTPQGGLSEDRSFRVKPGEPRPDQAVPELGPGDEEGVVVLLDQPLGHLEDRRKGGRGRRPGQREAGRPRQLRLLPRDHQGDA